MFSHDWWRKETLRWIDPILLLALGLVLIADLYPLLWWGDEPELLTAAWRNGVAHPTGYPVYLVLLKTFCLLPFGSIAWKGHFFSATCGVVSAGVLFRLLPFGATAFWKAIGWRIGVLAVILAPLVRGELNIAEVYGLSLLLLALCLVCTARFLRKPTLYSLVGAAAMAGLAVGHHRLLGLMLPGLAWALAAPFRDREARLAWIAVAVCVFPVVMILPYAISLERAAADPPLNWEAPSDWKGLWRLFSAEQFRIDQRITRIKEWMAWEQGAGSNPIAISGSSLLSGSLLPWKEMGLFSLFLPVGFFSLYRTHRRWLISGLTAWFVPALFVAQYHVGDQSTFWLLPLVIAGLGSAWGLSASLEWLATWRRPAAWSLALVTTVLLVDRSATLERPGLALLETPERVARRTLDEVPPGALLVAVPARPLEPADYTYFPLLYQQEVANRGKRVALISDAFMTCSWYRSAFLRQGLSGKFFEGLEHGTTRVHVHQSEVDTFVRQEIPAIQRAARTNEPSLRIHRVQGRSYLENRHTLGALLAEGLIPECESRDLYWTGTFPEMEPFLTRPMRWTEVMHLPVRTEGYPSLDGLAIPSGRLYRLDFQLGESVPR